MSHKTSRGLADAVRARGLRKGKPSEHDRPPVQPLPGPRTRPLPGQLGLADEIDLERRTP
jgi:hypothetical protein